MSEPIVRSAAAPSNPVRSDRPAPVAAIAHAPRAITAPRVSPPARPPTVNQAAVTQNRWPRARSDSGVIVEIIDRPHGDHTPRMAATTARIAPPIRKVTMSSDHRSGDGIVRELAMFEPAGASTTGHGGHVTDRESERAAFPATGVPLVPHRAVHRPRPQQTQILELLDIPTPTYTT